MKPAEKAMTPFELARVEAHILKMQDYRDAPQQVKVEILSTLAKDTFRLFAEVKRFQELEAKEAAGDLAARQFTLDELEKIETGEAADPADNLRRLVAEVRRFYRSHVCGEPFAEVVRERDALLEAIGSRDEELLEAKRYFQEIEMKAEKLYGEIRELITERDKLANVLLPAARSFAASAKMGAPIGRDSAIFAAGEALKAAVARFDPPPAVPICRPDPLDDIFPATSAGSPT